MVYTKPTLINSSAPFFGYSIGAPQIKKPRQSILPGLFLALSLLLYDTFRACPVLSRDLDLV
jgi:hypothetical protein